MADEGNKDSAASSNEQSIYAALELSKNSWLLALQDPCRDNPSLHPLLGGDAEGLMAKLDAARQRVAKDTDHRRHGEIDRRGAFR